MNTAASVGLHPQGSPDHQAQDHFAQMLPMIRRVARFAFRRHCGTMRDEMAAEVVGSAFVMFTRLVKAGKTALAYPSVLAWYGVRQVLEGRCVGSKLNIRDVSSPYCQRRTGVRVKSLQEIDLAKDRWQELVMEDRRATPADLAVARIDFADWLQHLPIFKRRVAQLLATGEATNRAAKRFKVSSARISQLRRELELSWEEFQGERLAEAA